MILMPLPERLEPLENANVMLVIIFAEQIASFPNLNQLEYPAQNLKSHTAISSSLK